MSTPNAERYLLEADNLRRRQLRSALLHGSSRTWRDRRRIWPAVVAGVVVVAIISAAIAIAGTFQAQQRRQQEQERQRIEQQQGQQQGQQPATVPQPGAALGSPPPARSAVVLSAWSRP
jgi:flagellar biosynthesis/type III secretory pathway M-ring protein FliF/YscJ